MTTQIARVNDHRPSQLVGVKVDRDHNDDGELVYLVTPMYRVRGRLVTVPDSRGWPTLAEARAEAARISRRG